MDAPCDRCGKYLTRGVDNGAVCRRCLALITIPVAEYEGLKRRANRFSVNELRVVLNVYENRLIDRYGWGDYPAEENALVDKLRAAIKEQEG